VSLILGKTHPLRASVRSTTIAAIGGITFSDARVDVAEKRRLAVSSDTAGSP
jgi:hypothetical protein